MGLDITAYRQLRPVRDYDESGEYDYETETRVWINPDFPGRCDEFSGPRKIYGFAERFDFRAGSYSGYNDWRDWLARLAGAKPLPGVARNAHAHGVFDNPDPVLPFVELIDFADNEGTIGTAVSAKLAADFAAHREGARNADTLGYYWRLYQDWQRAFEIAADGGAVTFH